jgi:uncharacterized protein
VTVEPAVLAALAAATALAGTVGGFGGAILLVPILVTAGMDPADAAPIGVVTVAAGALSAAPTQLASGLVHHRLGITIEVPASTAALIAALWSVHVSSTALRLFLAFVAFAAGAVGLSRAALHNPPRAEFAAEPPAEWPGTLGGTYSGPGGAVPYHARRLRIGLLAMIGAGTVSGLSGTGGGFIKTPVMREVMWIPVKVAAATSTFTMGITGATTLLVFASQGRVDPHLAAAAGVGGIVGGFIGARVQERLAPAVVRRVLAVALVVIAVVLAVGA